jgi:hypothetical protein
MNSYFINKFTYASSQNRTGITPFSTKGDFFEPACDVTPTRPLIYNKTLIVTLGWRYSQIQAVTYNTRAYLNIRQIPPRHIGRGNRNSGKYLLNYVVFMKLNFEEV